MLIFDNNISIRQKQWINTKVEFEWSKDLQKYVEISTDGYWYDGDMALCWTQTTDPYTFEGKVGIGTETVDNVLHIYKAGDGQTPVQFETGNNESPTLGIIKNIGRVGDCQN